MSTTKSTSKGKPILSQEYKTFSTEDWLYIFNQSPDHIVLLDKKFRIVFTNRPSPGLTLENLIGVPIYTLVEGAAKQKEIKQKLNAALKTGELCSYETEYDNPAGGKIYYVSEIVPWKSKEKILGLILSARDVTAQKLTQEKLENLSAFANSIIDQSPIPTWVADPDGTIIQVNQSQCNFLHLKSDQIVGKYNVLHDENLISQGVMPKVHAVFKEFKQARFIIQSARPKLNENGAADALTVWVDVSMFPVINKEGALNHVVCQIIDVTERENALSASLVSEQKYQTVIEDAPVMIDRFKPDGTILYANRRYCDFYGLSQDEIIGTNIFNTIPEPDIKIVKASFTNLTQANPTKSTQNTTIRHDGQPRMFHWIDRGFFDDQDNLKTVQSFGIDITEQQEAQQRLLESEQKYHSVVEDAPILIDQYLPDGTIIFSNQAYAQFFGKTPQEIVGRSFFELTPAESHESTKDHLKSLSPSNPFDTSENFATRHDGEKRWIRWTNHAFFDAKGKTSNFQSFGLDITNQKLAEQDRITLLDNLTEAQRIAQIGSWDWDLITNEETWSEELFRIFGRDPEPGAPPTVEYESQYHPNDRDHVKKAIRPNSLKKNFEVEFRIFRYDDKKERHVLLRAETIRNGEGREIRLHGTVQDITDRKAVEMQRDTLLQNLEEAQHIAHLGSWDWDLKTNTETWSKELFNIYGRDPQDGVPPVEKQADHYHPDDRAKIRKAIERALQTGSLENEYRILRYDDGSSCTLQVKGSVIYDDYGKPDHMIGTVQDVAELKNAEQEREVLLKNLSESQRIAHLGSWDWDLNSDTTSWTEELYRIYGRDPKLGPPHMEEFLDLVQAEDRIAMRQAIDSAFHTGSYDLEFKIIRQNDGKERILRSIAEVIKDTKGNPTHLYGTSIDITDLRAAEHELLRSEELNRSIVDHSGLGIGYYDPNGTILRMNKKACALMGRPEEDLIGHSAKEIYDPIIGDKLLERIQNAIDTRQNHSYEDQVDLPTGNLWFHSTYAATFNANGNATAVQIIFEDISSIKETEFALAEKNREMETLMGNLPGVAYRCDNDENSTMHYLSRGCYALTGYQPEDLLENKRITFNEIIHPDDIDHVDQTIQDALDVNQPFTLTYRIITAQGKQKWVWEQGVGAFADSDEFVSLEGFITDITERKQAEKLLRESEERFKAIFEQAGVGVALLNTSTGKYININQKYCDFLGYSKEEMLKKTYQEVTHPEDVQVNVIQNQLILKGQSKAFAYDKRYFRKDGTIVWGNLTISPLSTLGEDASNFSHIAIVQDITDRKIAESKVIQSEADLKQAQAVAHVGSWRWNIKPNTVTWSDEMYRIFGISKEKFSGSLPEIMAAAIHPDDVSAVEASNLSVMRHGKPIPLEYRIILPDGSIRTVWAEAGELALDDNGNPAHLTGVVMDITNRKLAQLELEESEARFRAFMDNLPATAYIKNEHLIHIYGNKEALDYTGKSTKEYIGVRTRDISPKKTAQELEDLDRIVLKEHKIVDQEGYYEGPDGEVRWKRNIKFPLTGSNGEKMIGGITLDLTDQKKAAEAIIESENRFRAFMDNLPAIVYIKNDQLKQVYGNQIAQSFLKKGDVKFEDTQTETFIPEPYASRLTKLDHIVLDEQHVVDEEGYYPTINGEMRWKRDIKFPLTGLNGEKMVGGITLDLTDQKKAEEAIHESELQFRSLFTAMSSGFALLEMVRDDKGKPVDHRFLQVNPTFEKQTGFKSEDLIGKTLLDVFPKFDREWIAAYNRVAQTGELFQRAEFNQRLKKYFNYKAFSPQSGQVAIIATDVDQQKKDQIALQQRADELERFNTLSVGRELKMIDLKREINELCRESGEQPRYSTSFADNQMEI